MGRRVVSALLCLGAIAAGCGSARSSESNAGPTPKAWPTEAQATTCASSFPSLWMGCLVKANPAFANVPLSYMALPGADNAGTFNLDPHALDTATESACTTFGSGIRSTSSLTSLKAERFSATQDETITRQLDGGIRWIDLKVGYNGGGNPIGGWRVTQNLYSIWPLSEYLDEIANWAGRHPTEAVVIDLSAICYDHDPSLAVDKGLWASFATKSAEGAGPLTLADVVARPSSFDGSLADATLRELGRGGRNVVVLIPSSARDSGVLRSHDHVYPVRVTPSRQISSASTEVIHSDPRFAPTGPEEFANANAGLAAYPTSAEPALGALRGSGLYVSKLAYELKGASTIAQNEIMSSFVGLVGSEGHFPAWAAGLQTGQYGKILARWRNRTNVVLADGVDVGGFTQAVIEQNGR